MDEPKLGQARRKRIIVRPSRFRFGLHELYVYHFPKHWSAACIANRELIKEAQQQAKQTKQLEDVSFEPVVPELTIRPKRHKEKNILDLAFAERKELYFPPPDIENCK